MRQAIACCILTCGGEEVEVLRLLEASLALELLALALEILDHVVLACKLVIIAEVIEPLPLLQPHCVEVLRDPGAIRPADIPVHGVCVAAVLIARHLLPPLLRLEDLVDRVPEMAAPPYHIPPRRPISAPLRAWSLLAVAASAPRSDIAIRAVRLVALDAALLPRGGGRGEHRVCVAVRVAVRVGGSAHGSRCTACAVDSSAKYSRDSVAGK